MKINLYADDLKVYKIHKNDNSHTNESDTEYLQQSLLKIEQWIENWCLKINENKTKVFRINSKIHDITQKKGKLEIKNHTLDETEIIRDLGIIIDNKLTFKQHINKIVKIGYFKARQIIIILKTKSIALWSKVYKTYVRPHLEYNSQIWNPRNKESILKIEKIQKYFTRNVLKKCRLPYVPYNERLKLFKLDELELRREITDYNYSQNLSL